MLAFMGLGIFEIVILGVMALLFIGVPVLVVMLVLSSKKNQNDVRPPVDWSQEPTDRSRPSDRD